MTCLDLEAVDKVLQRTADCGARGKLLAPLLQDAYTGSTAQVGLVSEPCQDAQEIPPAEWVKRLLPQSLPWEHNGQHPQADKSHFLEKIVLDDQVWGVVAVHLPEDAQAESLTHQLRVWCRYLATRLALEKETRQRERLEGNLAQQRLLADTGEIARPVVHELYNLLNTMTLQVEVLKLRFPNSEQDDFSLLKKQIVNMVEVLKWFRQYRTQSTRPTRELDLNQQVRRVVAGLQEAGSLKGNVEFDLEAKPANVVGAEIDIERLLRFLLLHAIADDAAHPPRIATRNVESKTLLTVEQFPPGPGCELHQFLESGHGTLDVAFSLELTACKMLLERFRGKLLAQNVDGTRTRVVIEFPHRKVVA